MKKSDMRVLLAVWPHKLAALFFSAALLFPGCQSGGKKHSGEALSDVSADEELLFLPSYAVCSADACDIYFNAWVFEKEDDSVKRALLRKALSGFIPGLEGGDENEFNRRASWIMVDQQSGNSVRLAANASVFDLGRTDANGHAEKKISIQGSFPDAAKNGTITFSTESAQTARKFSGKVFAVSQGGLSLISDIDDTIKISEVRDRKKFIANTFYLPFKAVPSMAKLYAYLRGRGVFIHYVSASPWQMYVLLSDFLYAQGFPEGSWHMKHVGLRDNFTNVFMKADEYKIPEITKIFTRFPKRKFILVGDSGEMDPEIYAAIYRKFPSMVEMICIRNVTGETPASARFAKTFASVPAGKWRLFNDGDDLSAMIRLSPEEK